ncbi:MAG: 16S rRNA (cytosine(967)-C(5))-methyltransferase RsmB [Verrucomicrobia bacterium]|nr:16S rRNA (cytosine(967)-C(5))-methyltransferase RsmB [Verrucomicrobiota bacterium]MBU1734108.1 16S rRNA (cytosine(967)-C(5))-methyltransferase RsmB [Verrucomicrobiota bacterium]MBU1856422.1 16S rRNA (cytosine(967)-C(5))-methyltransferase RsmB [Verrucomicrobiota bacterium]
MAKNLSNQQSSPTRAQAAAIIERWLVTGDFPNLMLENVREHRAFLMELVYGIVRWKRLLDWVVARYVRRSPLTSQQAFLLVGLYQLLKMTEVAPFAAVHETVEAAKAALGARQADFVNAILRRTLREKDALLAELDRQPLGIRQSHPDELLERWIRHFGLSPTEVLCAWNNQRADVIIRVNQLKTTPEAYLKTLTVLGVGDQVCPHAFPACFTLAHGMRVTDLPGYGEGHFMVIDPAAIQAVDLLDPQPGDHILDACAAPGGKTALIAERLRLKGQLVAMDLRADRLPRLRANLERLGCAAFVKVVQGDAKRLRPESFGRFDRILLDVPCSNTGVVRRKPDVRWRFSKAGLTRLGVAQRELLERAAGLVKRGGSIVYSTCSLEPEENNLLISAWLKTHPEFRLQSSRQSFPPTSGQDGAYAVLLTAK